MPKDTFYNISKEKQKRLIQAGISEFSKTNLHEASIANIVKEAEIPRGSFYQYFEGIEDLYFYLADLFKEHFAKKLHEAFVEENGDFEASTRAYANYYIADVMASKYTPFLKGLYLNMNHRLKQNFNEAMSENLKDQANLSFERCKKNDGNCLYAEDETELKEKVVFVMHILNITITGAFSHGWTVPETQAIFYKRFRWILYGMNNENKEKKVGKE